MLTHSKLTPKAALRRYALNHSLSVKGTQPSGVITVKDTVGHWSENWSMQFETWAEAHAAMLQIEHDYFDTNSRPWEVARKTYTLKMKPQTKVA